MIEFKKKNCLSPTKKIFSPSLHFILKISKIERRFKKKKEKKSSKI